LIDEEEEKIKQKKKMLKRAENIKYVKRDAVKKIIAACHHRTGSSDSEDRLHIRRGARCNIYFK